MAGVCRLGTLTRSVAQRRAFLLTHHREHPTCAPLRCAGVAAQSGAVCGVCLGWVAGDGSLGSGRSPNAAAVCVVCEAVVQGAPLPMTDGRPLAADLTFGAVSTRFNTHSTNATATFLRVGVLLPPGPAGRSFVVHRMDVSGPTRVCLTVSLCHCVTVSCVAGTP